MCGDASLQSSNSEICDDGNKVNGDGCTSSCTVESGWECTSVALAKSVCNLKCGNSKLESSNSEICDDGNNVNGDGCSSTCNVEY